MLKIRAYRPEDKPALVALWRTAGVLAWENCPNTTIRRKTAHSPDGLMLGFRNGQLVASVLAGYDGLRGWVYRLAVSPSERRQGIGRAMVERAEAWLRDQGCVRVKLQIEERGREAVDFYRRLGYVTQELTSMSKWLVPPESLT